MHHQLFIGTSNPLFSEIAHMCWWSLSIIAVGDDFPLQQQQRDLTFDRHIDDVIIPKLETMCWLSDIHNPLMSQSWFRKLG